MDFSEIIKQIIQSTLFREGLERISDNYSNLKQENHIRDLILEDLNQRFEQTFFKAFAEHPRINNTRVDLSIINQKDTSNPFKIEFKYQFSGDYKKLSDYRFVIRRDFEERQSDLFILVISHWDREKKRSFDNLWGIKTDLSKNIASHSDWKDNILNSFRGFENTELKTIEKIVVQTPFRAEYYFYLLGRT